MKAEYFFFKELEEFGGLEYKEISLKRTKFYLF